MSVTSALLARAEFWLSSDLPQSQAYSLPQQLEAHRAGRWAGHSICPRAQLPLPREGQQSPTAGPSLAFRGQQVPVTPLFGQPCHASCPGLPVLREVPMEIMGKRQPRV